MSTVRMPMSRAFRLAFAALVLAGTASASPLTQAMRCSRSFRPRRTASPRVRTVKTRSPSSPQTGGTTAAPPVVITKGWADAKNGIPLMMTAAEASTLYAQPAGAAAEGVFVQASMGTATR